jgi:hypothetical protein
MLRRVTNRACYAAWVQEEVEMLLPLILPIPNIKKGSVDAVISRARSENTKPLDKMNFDNRRAMIKSRKSGIHTKGVCHGIKVL